MKKFCFFLIAIQIATFARADYFEKLPYSITQPDGSTFSCFITGDEFYSRIHDINNFTIIQAADGYYYYAELERGILKPSLHIPGEVNPQAAGLVAGARITSVDYRSRYEKMTRYRTLKSSQSAKSLNTGILNNVVIYIRFADDTEFTSPRQAFYDTFNPSSGLTLNSYFREVSYNKLEIKSSHYPACDLTTNLSYKDYRNRSFFEPYNAVTNTDGYRNNDEKALREHSLLADAVTWVNLHSAIPASLDIDSNDDGKVDNVCFIIRGGGDSWNELLWSHRWALYTKDIRINGFQVYDYTFQPEGQLSVKTLCHEMFHVIGAPDLYHYENQGDINPVGCWDLMEGGFGHMTAYMKWKYTGNSWITEIPEINVSGTYRLNPLTSVDDNCFMIKSPFSEDEYFVIEYRKRTGTFESSLPGSGLIVSRVNPVMNGNSSGPPDEVYIFRPGGTTTANGNYYEAFLNSSSGRTVINDSSNPASFLRDGRAGGLHISEVREEGGQIVFKVTLSQDLTTDNNIESKANLVTSEMVSEAEPQFSVYPNPASTHIKISFPESAEATNLEIRDIKGTLVYSGSSEYSGNTMLVDLSGKTSGMYIIEIRRGNSRKSVNLIKL